jgi:hypothetical protein
MVMLYNHKVPRIESAQCRCGVGEETPWAHGPLLHRRRTEGQKGSRVAAVRLLILVSNVNARRRPWRRGTWTAYALTPLRPYALGAENANARRQLQGGGIAKCNWLSVPSRPRAVGRGKKNDPMVWQSTW